jgi:hypothetical protein
LSGLSALLEGDTLCTGLLLARQSRGQIRMGGCRVEFNQWLAGAHILAPVH